MVTSLSGSVIDDVKRTLARRNPLVVIQEAGCTVQGPGAPQSIIRALGVAAAANPDAILLVRGGGSFEDLMTFNDESLARAVAACPVPVVTGIGHEPDTSICDMVADRRCSTPTAAAESVAPALDEIVNQINDRKVRLERTMQNLVASDEAAVEQLAESSRRAMTTYLQAKRTYVESLASRRCLSDPMAPFEVRAGELNLTEERLNAAMPRLVSHARESLEKDARALGTAGRRLLSPFEAQLRASAGSLDALSPLRVLARGYAIAREANGHVVSDASRLSVGEDVTVLLGSGSFGAKVSSVDAGATDKA